MTTEPKIHYGHNVKRLRDLMGIKQELLAFSLNMSQQNLSHLEQRPDIDIETLEKIANAMKIPVEAIKNFNEEGIINIISNTFQDNSGAVMYSPTFNPIDKIAELYEKLLAEKDNLIAFLKSSLEKK